MLTNLLCGNITSWETMEADLIGSQNDTLGGWLMLGAQLVQAYRHW